MLKCPVELIQRHSHPNWMKTAPRWISASDVMIQSYRCYLMWRVNEVNTQPKPGRQINTLSQAELEQLVDWLRNLLCNNFDIQLIIQLIFEEKMSRCAAFLCPLWHGLSTFLPCEASSTRDPLSHMSEVYEFLHFSDCVIWINTQDKEVQLFNNQPIKQRLGTWKNVNLCSVTTSFVPPYLINHLMTSLICPVTHGLEITMKTKTEKTRNLKDVNLGNRCISIFTFF